MLIFRLRNVSYLNAVQMNESYDLGCLAPERFLGLLAVARIHRGLLHKKRISSYAIET
jgi:hypothetical protein